MNRTILITLAFALSAMACGKKDDKEARCNSVCAKIRDEDLAKCGSDAACKHEVEETFQACKGLCHTIATTKEGPHKSMNEQADDAEKKCANGDADSCATIGGAYLLGKGGKVQDEKKGVELVKKACDGKSAFGCEIYGRALDEGRGVAVDKDGAKTYFQKSCELGGGGGCRAFAMRFETTDPARIPYLQKACDKDDKLGCMGLGAAYLHGNQGAPKDAAKAKQFLQKACDLGAQPACDKVHEI
ncbi:MAG TPA: tetratricopeptide repeat protein [Kofleriaceae bacterium]